MSKDIPFTAQVAILDQYIHSKNPEGDLEIADLILESIRKNDDIRRYFFSSRPDPSWIPILWRSSFFAKQPEFEVNSQGTFLTFWYAHEFLLSVASDVPEYIIKHLDNLDSCHDWYKAGAVESLTKLDPTLVSTVIPKVLDWLKTSNSNWSLSHKASELMVFMAKNNYHDQTFDLFSALTDPILDLNTKEATKFTLNEASLPEHSPIKDYKPGNEYLIALEKLDVVRLINILDENLRSAINKESGITGRDNSKVSYWRSAIEDSEQDLGESAKDSLLRALRDTLDHIVAQSIETAQPIVDKYINDDFEIFQRLAIYFLHRYPKVFRSMVVKELLNFSNLDETGIHHEFFLLLQEGFPVLDEKQRATLVNAILQGPPKVELERFVESVAQNDKRDPDEFRENYINYWIKNRLWMIRVCLTNDSKEILDNLIAASGEPDHPDFTSWISSDGWMRVTDNSPLEEEALRAMSPNELYNYIQAWEPDAEKKSWPQRITWEGLAGSIANIIVANPEKYISHLELITYHRSVIAQSIFGHLTNDNYPIHERSWVIWLELIESLANNKDYDKKFIRAEDINSDWAQTYRSIVQLIKRGLQHKDSTLPSELLPKIRDILLVMIYNPDPNSEQDKPGEGWFGHLDPLTVSINRVRPMALDALVIYAIKNAKLSNNGSKKIRWEQSVKDAFTRKLEKKEDPSWAVHSIFGKYLSSFYWLDKKWTVKNINGIFPEDDEEESIWFFISAWESFLLDGYRSYLMPLLHNKYIRGIEYLAKGYQTKSHLDIVSRLSIHVVIDYCLGEYLLESEEGQNSLLVNLTIQTSPQIRAYVANACYLVYRDNPKDAEKFWLRVKEVWEWRNKEASINNHSSEFDEEMRKFGNIPLIAPAQENIITLWPLLEGLLPHVTRGDGFRYDWISIEKFLLKEAKTDPARAIQFYKMMYDQLTERPKWIYHSDEAKELIIKVINSGNEDAKQITLNLLDNLLRWGDNTFKDIYFAFAK